MKCLIIYKALPQNSLKAYINDWIPDMFIGSSSHGTCYEIAAVYTQFMA